MYISGKRVEELQQDDIKRLVENCVSESKYLDYKKEIKIGVDNDKKEFLFDITSMYNTEGGCLVYGVEERKDEKGKNTGVPEKILGIGIGNVDKLTLQIESIVKDGTQPSISNLAIKQLEIDGKQVLIIGILKGIGLPAMVTFNNTNKFFRRNNGGKYAVDVYELNQMFMQNQLLNEKAEEFRIKRIKAIRSLGVLPNLRVTTSLFVQIIPFSFLNGQVLDLSIADKMQLRTFMAPFSGSSSQEMFNADGYMTYSLSNDRRLIENYDQFFRTGIYEFYTALAFEDVFDTTKTAYMPVDSVIPEVLKKIKASFQVLKKFEIDAPLIICISFHGIKNKTLKGDRRAGNLFTSDDLLLPPITLSTFETSLSARLKPVLDILWQAAGFPESNSYRGY